MAAHSLNRAHLFIVNQSRNRSGRTGGYMDVVHGVRTLRTVLDIDFIKALPPDGPCIVVDDLPNVDHARFVDYLTDAVASDPSRVYTFSGYSFDGVEGGQLSPIQKVTMYDRMPFTPRYRQNDEGPVDVDLLKDNVMACTAGILSKIVQSMPSKKFDCVDASTAIARLGIGMTCLEPPVDWSGLPRTAASNRGSIKMDTDRFMGLFTFRGWHEAPVRAAATQGGTAPKVAVIVTTHNRTKTAKLAIESLVARLKYPDLEWIIADDRSDRGHVRALVEHAVSLGVKNIRTTETNKAHWGLGASLNNALHAAFRTCDIVLTTEDDWYLQRDLCLEPLVKVISENTNVAAIRLGAMFKAEDHLIDSSVDGFYKVTNGSRFSTDRTRMLLNLQVAIRHRRLYDALGYYPENKKPDTVEADMNERFCSYTREGLSDNLVVLWPKKFERKTLDSRINPFVHFGESTCGHDYAVPEWLAGKTSIGDVDESEPARDASSTIHVAMVSDYNGWKQLDKVVRSIRKTNDGSAVHIHVVAYDNELATYVRGNIPASASGVTVEVSVISAEDRERVDACATPQDGKQYSVPPVGLVKFMLGRYIDTPKVLYMDTDTLVRKPLRELYDTDLEGNALAAVVDPGCLFLDKERFPMISGNREYFNSGVMLMDLDKIRDGGFETVLFHRKRTQPDLLFQDQDILNAEFFRYVKLLPPKFNVLMGAVAKVCDIKDLNELYGTDYASGNDLIDAAVIWHWASGDKPWMSATAPRAAAWLLL